MLVGVFGIAAAAAVAPPSPESGSAVISLLGSRCGACHAARGGKGGLNLSSPAGIAAGGISGPAVTPGKPADSRLLTMIETGKMPPGGRLPAAEIRRIRDWITAGSPGLPKESGPRITQHQIIPIMYLRCAPCHGGRRKEAGLDLRTPAGMRAGGKSGPAIVPGKPEESRLLKRVHAGEMPPPRMVVAVSVKPMEPGEIRLLEDWIRLGAPEVEIAADVQTRELDPLVADKDRLFWAFQAPKRPAVPALLPGARTTNPIDAFLLKGLKARGLDFSPEADRRELIRRVTLDLTGLPPTPDDVKAYLADAAPGAYERVVDRLLASPRYGEQWGRRWLDLAGYSDSEGIQESDPIRPYGWRYRDYVVRSLNADKPYDRFLLEQIAGDELYDYARAPEITSEIADSLIATAFLRQVPDATFANITNFVPDRLDIIGDEMQVLSSSVMGLTMKCARCHDHKFDPIPQRDYYRLLAVFKGALDEHDWLTNYDGERPEEGSIAIRDLPYAPTAEVRAWRERETARRAEVERVKAALKAAEQAARSRIPAAGDEADLKKRDAEYARAATDAAAALKALDARREAFPRIRALWDRGEPSPTYLLRRGDYLKPGPLLGPGVPSVLTNGKTPLDIRPPFPGARSTGRRLAFARWLTQPGQPLTARVIVNRIWKWRFGRGIVATVDNFGKMGARPTHPELLDWLSTTLAGPDFGWRLKPLHRLMVTSRAYRQSSRTTAEAVRRDPDNRWLGRMPLRRMDAEELHDTLLQAVGELDVTPGGPSDPIEVREDGMVTVTRTARGWRRALYGTHRRKQPITLLEAFDRPQMNPNCTERPESTVAPQALQLMNSERVNTLAASFARRVRSVAGAAGVGEQIRVAFELALGRPPSGEEAAAAITAIGRWSRTPAPAAGRAAVDPLQRFCHALLNSAGFLYVD